ncbi:MAG: type I methionyl aminopeptidase [Chloroflexi bacterium]|nr:type I methionyl aminopeptidase [Chloroflexota bacterium]
MILSERRVTLKSRSQVEKMRTAGRLVADVLDRLSEEVRPGVTTGDLDRISAEMIRRAGGVPSFVGVPGPLAPYRHTICVSIDDEVVHGIPGKRRIEPGEVVSIDAGAIIDGWHGDAARTFVVGDVPPEVRLLVDETRRAMDAGIAAARPGASIGDVAAAVEGVALEHGYGVLREYGGHGIGTEMHEEPFVPNHRDAGRGRKLEVGLCLAIEPMFTLGGHEVRVGDDGWTVSTVDGSIAAHWEQTIAIMPDGPEILTVNGRDVSLSQIRHV